MIERWDDEQPKPGGPARFCPSCGRPRAVDERFCASCGHAFETAAATSALAAVSPPTMSAPADPVTALPKPDRAGPIPRLIGGILIVGVLIWGLNQFGTLRGASVPGVNSANTPPVGVIWFGSSFDPGTFEIRGKSSTAAVGTPFAMVGHLTRSINSGDANLRIALDGTTYVNQALTLQGSGELFGITYTAPVAGTYTFTITDVGGNQLAAGGITIS